ncbi:hypothetical protein D9613_007812 [Agrocybe pediades]|uniref:Carbohydrate kinase PfkB domain-containing protein n=1 Tax=Agrocybe pediades TaxID=84607 RepID=A0A8H4QP85_9AGAR|nr:hypothetical protein D9613_007812 [Agrocybe pediades]
MNKLRRDRSDDNQQNPAPSGRSLRIVASGTLFQTHTLSIPHQPAPSAILRAHGVQKARGGSASVLLSILAQFPTVEAVLVAPLGGNEEGRVVLKDLENEGVITQYCKIWHEAGVPSSWVLHASDDNTKTVINHNPLPDITHEDFISLIGPLLAPENYQQTTPSTSPTIPHYGSSSSLVPPPSASVPRISQSGPRPPNRIFNNPFSPAPFDWLHFEGRSVKTTLSNIMGVDGLAREKKWRSHCVISVDVGRRGRQGVEALFPHADVLFFNKQYALATDPKYGSSPRAFLLSLVAIAPPHALLIAYWGKDGAAVLSLPTREYLQSSGWVEDRAMVAPMQNMDKIYSRNVQSIPVVDDIHSVRSGSGFWADGRSRTPSSNNFTVSGSHYMSETGDESNYRPYQQYERIRTHRDQGQRAYAGSYYTAGDDDNFSQQTETPQTSGGVIDEMGAQDAFVAGMIFALSRRLCPGLPYTPAWSGDNLSDMGGDDSRGKWKLDECLKFATELSGRKARKRGWAGLGHEMAQAGWFDSM